MTIGCNCIASLKNWIEMIYWRADFRSREKDEISTGLEFIYGNGLPLEEKNVFLIPDDMDDMTDEETKIVVQAVKKLFLQEQSKYFDSWHHLHSHLFIQPGRNILGELFLEDEVNGTFLDVVLSKLGSASDTEFSFVILGGPGAGKTRIALEICKLFWDNYKNTKSDVDFHVIPFYILLTDLPLPSYSISFVNYLELYAELHKIDLDKLTSRSNFNIVVFLDGYDQIPLSPGHWKPSNRMNIKFVHLVRTNRFSILERKILFGKSCPECFLNEFSDTDIDEYVDKFSRHLLLRNRNFSSRVQLLQNDYLKLMETHPDFKLKIWLRKLFPSLAVLGKNPLMLRLITESLAPVVNFGIGIEPWKIKKQIYDTITTKWFEWYANSQSGLMISLDKFKTYCRAQAMNWSQEIICMDVKPQILSVDLLEPVNDRAFLNVNWENDRQIFLENELDLRAVQLSLPANICKDSLILKPFNCSLLEYFTDRDLFGGLIGEYEHRLRNAIPAPLVESIIKLNLVTKRHLGVLSSLATDAKIDERFLKLLFDLIFASKSKSWLSVIAANAITILNLAGESFSGKDFRHVQIPGANLSYSLCGNTDFRGADLRNVVLNYSWLVQAKFEGSNFNNLKVGFKQTFTLPDKCMPHHKRPLYMHMEFWKGPNQKLFLFVSIECLNGLFEVYQFRTETGELVNSQKPFRLRLGLKNAEDCIYGFQIFKNYIALWNSEKMKVFNLINKVKVRKAFNISMSSCANAPFKHGFWLNDPNSGISKIPQIPVKFKPSPIIQLKINQSGSFLAIIFDDLTFQNVRDNYHIVVYEFNLTRQQEPLMNAKVYINCDRCILGLDFALQKFIFTFQGGIGILNLENPNEFKTIVDLPKVFGGEIDHGKRYFRPFVIDPRNNDRVAVYGQDGATESEKLFIIDVKRSEIVNELETYLNIHHNFGPSSIIPSTILQYVDSILASISNTLTAGTSTLRIFDTKDYQLIYHEDFQESIREMAVGYLCPGIYEVAISVFEGSTIKTLEISAPHAINAEQIEFKALFSSKFPSPKRFSHIYDIKPSSDGNLIVIVNIPDFMIPEVEDERIYERKVEIWDSLKGKTRSTFTVESRKYYFTDWMCGSVNAFFLIVKCKERNLVLKMYDDFGKYIQSWIIRDGNLPYLLRKVNHFQNVYLCMATDDEYETNIGLFEYVFEKDIVSFQRVPNLSNVDPMDRYYIALDDKLRSNVALWDLGKMEIVIQRKFDTLAVPGLIGSDLIVLTDKELYVWNILEANEWKTLRQFNPGSEKFTRHSIFEPKLKVFILIGKSGDNLSIFSYPELKRNAFIRFWFPIKSINVLQTTESKLRTLVTRISDEELLCVEFDITKDFHWSLVWARLSYLDFNMDQALMKNVLNLDDQSEKLMKGHGAEGQRSIPRETFVSRADLIYPIPGTSHLSKISKFQKCLQEELTFNENQWIISAIAVKTAISGIHRREHMCLLVEGESNCRKFIFRAELSTKHANPFIQVHAFKSLEEIDKFILDEGISQKWVYFQKEIPRTTGEVLVESILLDRKNTYFVRGENCIDWIEDKLGVIGIEFKMSWWYKLVNRARKLRQPPALVS